MRYFLQITSLSIRQFEVVADRHPILCARFLSHAKVCKVEAFIATSFDEDKDAMQGVFGVLGCEGLLLIGSPSGYILNG